MSDNFADFYSSYQSICKIEIRRGGPLIQILLHRHNSKQWACISLCSHPDSDPPEIVIDERLGDWHQHDIIR